MKNIMKVLYCLIFLVLLGILGYEMVEKNFDIKFLAKGGAAVLTYTVFLLRVFVGTGEKKSITDKKAYYKKRFEKFIGDVFENDKKSEKLLYSAIDDYVQGQPEKGLQKLNKLQSTYQTRSELFTVSVFSGLCCFDMKLYHEAIEHYKQALNIRQNTTLYSNTGLCYERLADWDNAILYYRSAMDADPDNATAINNYAQLCIRAQRYDLALDYASYAVKLNPHLAPAWNALAICHHVMGNTAEYERCFRSAVNAGSDPKKLKNYIKSLDTGL